MPYSLWIWSSGICKLLNLWIGLIRKKPNTHHIFPFVYGLMDKLYQYNQKILKITTRKTIDYVNIGAYCVMNWVGLFTWTCGNHRTRKHKRPCFFFKTLEVDFIKQWDGSHNILCDQLASYILPTQGRCTYLMLIMENGWF
jgi:hypothetical protein